MKTKQLPEGWKEVELGDITFVNDRDHYTPEYFNAGIPLISPKDFIEGGGINLTKLKFVSKEEHKNFVRKCNPKKGDILYSRIGTIGIPKIIDFDFDFVALHSIAVVKPKDNLLNDKFLYYLLKSPEIREQAKRGTKSIGTPDLGLREIRKFRILLPPLPTQKAIVSILEKAEALKQKRQEADKLTKEYLQSVFQEMFYNKGFEEAELGKVCEVKKGTSLNQDRIGEGNIPVIAGGQKPAYNYYESNRQGETITISGSGAYAGFVNYFNIPIYATDCTTIQNEDNSTNTRYVFYFLKSIQDRIYEFQQGIAQPHVYPRQIQSIKIPLPHLPLQQKFASIVEHVEKLKEKQKQSKEKIDELFNSLMQRAFKGELVR